MTTTSAWIDGLLLYYLVVFIYHSFMCDLFYVFVFKLFRLLCKYTTINNDDEK